MDNLDTRATLGTRHRTKTNKQKKTQQEDEPRCSQSVRSSFSNKTQAVLLIAKSGKSLVGDR